MAVDNVNDLLSSEYSAVFLLVSYLSLTSLCQNLESVFG